MKMRDMSVLNTAAAEPPPIETYRGGIRTRRWSARAMRQEVERGGQVYYLHNRVESLQEIQAFLQATVPEVLVATAHGKLDRSSSRT